MGVVFVCKGVRTERTHTAAGRGGALNRRWSTLSNMRSNAVTLDSKSHYNKAAQAYQVVCTMGFNTRSLKKAAFEQVAWMDTSSLVGQGLHHDQTTARNLASAALLDALSAREANWYAAAEHNDHHVADVGHGRTRRASSTARHELKNLQSRNDLLKFEYVVTPSKPRRSLPNEGVSFP